MNLKVMKSTMHDDIWYDISAYNLGNSEFSQSTETHKHMEWADALVPMLKEE